MQIQKTKADCELKLLLIKNEGSCQNLLWLSSVSCNKFSRIAKTGISISYVSCQKTAFLLFYIFFNLLKNGAYFGLKYFLSSFFLQKCKKFINLTLFLTKYNLTSENTFRFVAVFHI